MTLRKAELLLEEIESYFINIDEGFTDEISELKNFVLDKLDWRNAEENLPTMYSAVLGCNMDGMSSDEREPFVAGFDDTGWFEPWTDKECVATHWLPLPTLPEEKNER